MRSRRSLERKAAVVIGPGLGAGDHAASWVGEVLAAGVPAVLDADALNLVAGVTAALASSLGPIVITPHPGEAARLLDTTIREIEADRLAAARALAARSRAVVVLKGARTIVCDGTLGRRLLLDQSDRRSRARDRRQRRRARRRDRRAARPGPGAADDAARAGVFVHGRAGDWLAQEHGDRGVISSDLAVAIAGVIRGDLASSLRHRLCPPPRSRI